MNAMNAMNAVNDMNDPTSSSSSRSDLAFVRQVVADSRRAVALDAKPFLAWGVLVVTGVVLESLFFLGPDRPSAVWLWMALVAVGLGISMVAWRRRRRRRGALTLAERALAGLWMSCWAAMVVVGFGGFFLAGLSGSALLGTLSALMGVGFLSTGTLVDHALVRHLGTGWLLAALGLFVLPDPLALAAFGGAVLVLQVVPGIYLQRRWRRERASRDP